VVNEELLHGLELKNQQDAVNRRQRRFVRRVLLLPSVRQASAALQ